MWRPSHRGNWFFVIIFSKSSLVYCNWTFDSVLCWPPTVAGHATKLKCPDQNIFDPTSKAKSAIFCVINEFKWIFFLSLFNALDFSSHVSTHDTTEFAVRKCSTEGFWEGKPGVVSTSTVGWTDFSGCYFPEFKKLLEQLGEEREVRFWARIDFFLIKFHVKFSFCSTFPVKASNSRANSDSRIFGSQRLVHFPHHFTCDFLSFSVRFSLLLANHLLKFAHAKHLSLIENRILKNNRTKIHRNLFIAMVIQVFIRLTLYIDQVNKWCAIQRFSSWLTLLKICQFQGNHEEKTQRGIRSEINCWNKHQ